MRNLLKATALALVLAFGSIGGIVWASAGSQPGSPLYPVRMTIEKMGLTTTADEVTETQPQMEFAQEQAEEMQQPADNDQDDTCPNGNCDAVRDRDRERDGTCEGGNCGGDQGGDHDGDQGGDQGGGD